MGWRLAFFFLVPNSSMNHLFRAQETPMSAVYRLRHRQGSAGKEQRSRLASPLPARRTGVTVAGKRIQKGSEVHRSGDYLNEVQMLQKLSAAPYIVSLHGFSAARA